MAGKEPQALAPGDVLVSHSSKKKYICERCLGQGGFGTVWLCSVGKGKCAVKFMANSGARFLKEMAHEVEQCRRAVDAAGEELIPKLWEASEGSIAGKPAAGHLLIAIDFIDGTNAGGLARTTCLSLEASLSVLGDVLQAMTRLHALKLAHCDLKGDNVLVSREGKSYLCDFGISGQEDELRRNRQTAGTPDYMAPEVLAEPPLPGTKADIWSFGVLALELAFGCSHFEELAKRGDFGKLEWLAKNERPKVPKMQFGMGYSTLVSKCLVRDHCYRVSADDLKRESDWNAGGDGRAAVRRILDIAHKPRTGRQPSKS